MSLILTHYIHSKLSCNWHFTFGKVKKEGDMVLVVSLFPIRINKQVPLSVRTLDVHLEPFCLEGLFVGPEHLGGHVCDGDRMLKISMTFNEQYSSFKRAGYHIVTFFQSVYRGPIREPVIYVLAEFVR